MRQLLDGLEARRPNAGRLPASLRVYVTNYEQALRSRSEALGFPSDGQWAAAYTCLRKLEWCKQQGIMARHSGRDRLEELQDRLAALRRRLPSYGLEIGMHEHISRTLERAWSHRTFTWDLKNPVVRREKAQLVIDHLVDLESRAWLNREYLWYLFAT